MKRFLILVLMLFSPAIVDAQLHIEVRGGSTIGSLSASRAGLELIPKASFDVIARYDLSDTFTTYGGFSRWAFGCEDQFCSGFKPTVAGTHAMLGGGVGWRELWARAGVMFGVADVNGASDINAAEAGFGMQAMAGFRFNIYDTVQCLPGVSLERVEVNNDWATAISLDIGVGYSISF